MCDCVSVCVGESVGVIVLVVGVEWGVGGCISALPVPVYTVIVTI